MHDYLSKHKSMNHAFPEATDEQLRYYLQAYLLSATLKDCSVMFRIAEGEEFIKVVDLDVKGTEKFTKWLTLDREVASHYSGDKVCVDSLPQ